MHELSLLHGLLGQIEDVVRENGAERATRVRLRLGPLAHIELAHLREHFLEAAKGTVAEGALLEIEKTDTMHDLTLEEVDVETDEVVPQQDC